MWVYRSPIGLLKLVPIKGIWYFQFGEDDTCWTGHKNPQVVADDVYCHATGCVEWDCTNVEGPHDLSEWKWKRIR